MCTEPVYLPVLQNAVIEGQETPLRISFAKDKPTERPPPTSTIASDALQVITARSSGQGAAYALPKQRGQDVFCCFYQLFHRFHM